MERIAILGGGIAALTTAYELSKTPLLRARYRIDVYQMGFRLGGKLASGRTREQARNLEHGLHVWFGCYENAFGLLRELYRDWQKDPRAPFQCWRDAIEPRTYVPIGDEQRGDFFVHQREWLTADGSPGEGRVEITLGFLLSYLHDMLGQPRWLTLLTDRLGPRLARLSLDPSAFTGGHAGAPALLEKGRLTYRYRLARGVLRVVRARVQSQRERASAGGERGAQREGELLYAELLLSALLGLLDPRYGVVHGEGLSSLNGWDLRAWLAENGASDACVRSSFVSLLYEAAFASADGNASALNMEAGTALNILVRLFTYKGAILWEVRAGMGDVLIAPLYQLLESRGVRFHFFHKVRHLGLSQDGSAVERIEIGVQARTRDAYEPLMQHDFMPVWPCEPLWEQLEQGEALRARGVDFESHWCAEPFVENKCLRRRHDFDHVVLAMALGVFKPLNAEPGPCQELIAASPAFARMVHTLQIVPTQALQLWFDRDLARLGFARGGISPAAAPIMVNSPQPYTAWADMSSLLAFEAWPASGGPRGLHYLCGMLSTNLHRCPSTARDVEQRGHALARAEALHWLTRRAPLLWPGLLRSDGSFDWSVLHAPEGVEGEARLDAQFFRANVNPTDCTVAVVAGTSEARLGPDESGFCNLFLAGAWTRTPVFVECVEGAVMSGKAAARAISRDPIAIPGEGWLWSRKHSAQPPAERIAAE